MSGLRTIIVKPIIIAAVTLALLISLALTTSMLRPTTDGGSSSNPSISRIELQSHNGPGKHKRCKPKGKYGKPKKPKKCRRRPR